MPAGAVTAGRARRGRWVLLAVIGLCCAIEAALQLAQTFALAPRLRASVYENGAFWAGLLRGWTPNYAAQPYAMFVTYGFLHTGLVHLVVNMFTLGSLGAASMARVGTRATALVYFGAMIGGAAGHAVLAASAAPMVGASGALFGLAGALLAWACVDRLAWQETLWPVLRAAGFLIALNVVLWWAMDGQLAWQTHLAGFLAGGILALVIDARPRPPEAGG